MKFQGFEINQDSDGYFWRHDGYFDTVEECQGSIADWNDEERDQLIREGRIEDTPSLPAPWWAER